MSNQPCYRCGGLRHILAECTTPHPSVACRMCGSTAHVDSRRYPCPSTMVVVCCMRCTGLGHLDNNCPTLCKECVSGPRHERHWCPRLRCSRCGGGWHLIEDCTSPPATYCQTCGGNHSTVACVSQQGVMGCPNCHGMGHGYGQYQHIPCPVPYDTTPICQCGGRHELWECQGPGNPAPAFVGLDTCGNCGLAGHSQRHCPTLNPPPGYTD